MKVEYSLRIENPHNHNVLVAIKGNFPKGTNKLSFYMPSWSPGSYLMREYGRNVSKFMARNGKGEVLHFIQVDKGVWEVDREKSEVKSQGDDFEITYEVYCHELTVRTSHVDASHAFIHGPSVFMGIKEHDLVDPVLKVEFPALWSKITTGLKDISPSRDKFTYTAPDYDTLIDSPLEIGCHETDGFRHDGKDHELAFYGAPLFHKADVKQDMKTIVETVSKTMQEIPYEKYTFITHFAPKTFGGLEHSNSTALQFCSMYFAERKGYVRWLSLVAHEYFHTWNVKRIRPRELGPFDYLNEAKTRLLWLAEGLTSFMDEAFVFRSGLCSLEEYLEMQKDNLNRYFQTPGRRFHSLEDSSFNAWIKLYRRDENTNNSSISYYLKGGIVFWVLNVLFFKEGKKMDDLLDLLWKSYKERPELGLTDEEVYNMIESVGGKSVRDQFETMITTTEEIDLEKFFKDAGLSFEWEENKDKGHLGVETTYEGDRVVLSFVALDGPAYQGGLNAGDEIIAVDGMRLIKDSWDALSERLLPNHTYTFTVSRLNRLVDVSVQTSSVPRILKSIKVEDEKLATKVINPEG